jgi:hypothetical protein
VAQTDVDPVPKVQSYRSASRVNSTSASEGGVSQSEMAAPQVSEATGLVQGASYSDRLTSQADQVVSQNSVREGKLSAGAKSVDASVGEVIDRVVVFYCKTSSGRVSIRLPKEIVPVDVLSYGQSVRISLALDGGFRYPKIEKRVPVSIQDSEEEAELDAWVNDL